VTSPRYPPREPGYRAWLPASLGETEALLCLNPVPKPDMVPSENDCFDLEVQLDPGDLDLGREGALESLERHRLSGLRVARARFLLGIWRDEGRE
jgi:hypothetical protein